MFTKNKKISILSYWTRSYLLPLIIGLIVLLIISAFWLRFTTINQRIEMMELFAEMTVQQITRESPEPNAHFDDILRKEELHEMRLDPFIFVTDTDGEIITMNRPMLEMENTFSFASLIENNEVVQQLTLQEKEFYAVKKEVELEDELVGYVFAFEHKENITRNHQQFGYLFAFILIMGILGWIAIYFLSKRLTKPILDVANAATLIQNGEYQVQLRTNYKEREIDELVTSFKEMAKKLEQLEKTRTELLAGVTHELKTPITSISGLLQAVKEGIVDGEEARKFIEMAYDETTKMKTMVGDLLVFNSFAVDAVPIERSIADAQETVAQIANAFSTTRPIQIELMGSIHAQIEFDKVRLEQIFANLFTNSIHACDGECKVLVELNEDGSFVRIDVTDNGRGIPENEQPYIFERFYRGEGKKYAVRGLGLGLSLSKMIAQSMDGDLQLKGTSPKGTTFSLYVRKSN